jgi:hypothetical protein
MRVVRPPPVPSPAHAVTNRKREFRFDEQFIRLKPKVDEHIATASLTNVGSAAFIRCS